MLTDVAEIESPAGGIIVFDVLQSLALFFLIITLVPAIFSSIKPMRTWYTLIVSSVVYRVSFRIMLGHQTGPEPPLPLCTVQAGLM